jgi:diguanylate cyclase (GGDEF)-like protein
MVYQRGASWDPSLINGAGLFEGLMSKMRESGKLTDLLDTASSLGRDFLDVDRVKILQFTADGSTIVIAASSNCEQLPANCGHQYPAYYIPVDRREFLRENKGQISIDLTNRRSFACSEPTSSTQLQQCQGIPDIFDKKYLTALTQMGLVGCLVIPILDEDKLWGLFMCQHIQPKHFQDKQLQTIRSIVDLLSFAIVQSQLLARNQLHARRERVLERINTLLHATPLSPQLESELLGEISRALDADGGRLLILGEPIQRAQLYNYGIQPHISTPIEKNILWKKVLASAATQVHNRHQNTTASSGRGKQIYQIDDIYQQPSLEALFPAFRTVGIQSLLILPLRSNHQCVGCLTVFRAEANRKWTNEELQLAQSLAIHLSLAVAQRRVEYMFRRHAYYDSLTGLPNRSLLQQRLTIALAKMDAAGDGLAVIVLDLDRFKMINDSLGHICGDRLLKLVAERLKKNLDDTAIIGRWSGDEFTLIIPGLSSIKLVHEIAKKVQNCLKEPFEFPEIFPTLKTNSLYLKASMGIAIAPLHGTDSETLLKRANAALYRAKQNGKNQYEIYTIAISHVATERLRLENILYQAIESEQLFLHYQPQVDLKTGKIAGIEALVRCQDRYGKLISPADFIPIAEETGSIDRIGEWVLRQACQQNQFWRDMGLGNFPVAVNLSTIQLQEKNLIDVIAAILADTRLSPDGLEIEITESVAIKDLDLTIDILQCLRGIGVKISLDDFGTGYSSLASLKYLPLDRLKIDRSFVRELRADTIEAGIVKAIINLGHELDLNVVAEGVETIEQLEFLKSINCDAVQGFLFSRPLSAIDLEPLIIHGGYWHQDLTSFSSPLTLAIASGEG